MESTFKVPNRDKEIKVQQNRDFPVLRTWQQFQLVLISEVTSELHYRLMYCNIA